MDENLNLLCTRVGFNFALNHFKLVTKLINDFQDKVNLADLLNNCIIRRTVKQNQLIPILNIILIDKFKYYFKSKNLRNIKIEDLSSISDKIKNWSLLDFVLIYYHPQLGQILINPRNKKSWEAIVGGMKENELLVIYVGDFTNEIDSEIAEKGINSLLKLFYGQKVSDESIFNKLTSKYAKKIPKKSIESASVRGIYDDEQRIGETTKKLSPEYGITVTNELFHNGNVEAWKKIIESFEMKYRNQKVLIFYEKEQINDINTLFKWGKVKHGTMIVMRIMADEFKDISKLRRYLFQGASPKFEAFLRGAPGQILSLF